MTTDQHRLSAVQQSHRPILSLTQTIASFMKIQPDKFDVQSISGYGPGWVGVGAEKIETSVVFGSRGQRFAWACDRFEDLSEAHFALLTEQSPELVIFGSGNRIRFPQPAWLASLYSRRIGIETMDTQAACRTYNILAGEGRDVLLALLIEPEV